MMKAVLAIYWYSPPEQSKHSTAKTIKLELRLTLTLGLTVSLVMAKILNVVQVFTSAHTVTVCYCCYCCSAVSKQKMSKNPGKPPKYLGFPGYFRVLPALDAEDRRGFLPGLC